MHNTITFANIVEIAEIEELISEKLFLIQQFRMR
jgi:hypothetical protein